MRKQIRRIALIILIFVFAAFEITTFAQQETDESENSVEIVRKLNAMGVWDETVEFSEQVTRGEFAVALARLMNIGQMYYWYIC